VSRRRQFEGATGGQLVLLAAGLVAVALVAMLLAYAQVDAPVGATGEPRAAVTSTEVTGGLVSIARNASRGVGDRASGPAVARTVRQRVDRDVTQMRASWLDRGAVVDLEWNRTAARRWARRDCPGGRHLTFGDCRPRDGLVTQRRAGEWYVVALALDVRLETDRRRARLRLGLAWNGSRIEQWGARPV
jgi:hypothetical protein